MSKEVEGLKKKFLLETMKLFVIYRKSVELRRLGVKYRYEEELEKINDSMYKAYRELQQLGAIVTGDLVFRVYQVETNLVQQLDESVSSGMGRERMEAWLEELIPLEKEIMEKLNRSDRKLIEQMRKESTAEMQAKARAQGKGIAEKKYVIYGKKATQAEENHLAAAAQAKQAEDNYLAVAAQAKQAEDNHLAALAHAKEAQDNSLAAQARAKQAQDNHLAAQKYVEEFDSSAEFSPVRDPRSAAEEEPMPPPSEDSYEYFSQLPRVKTHYNNSVEQEIRYRDYLRREQDPRLPNKRSPEWWNHWRMGTFPDKEGGKKRRKSRRKSRRPLARTKGRAPAGRT